MSKNRWQERQQRTRLEFIQAALMLVIEQGYEAMTVQSIADRANYGRSTFYTYFKDKEEVVWALFEHYMGELDAFIIDTVKHLESPEREYVSWQIIFRNIEAQRDFFVKMGGQESLALRNIMKEYLIKQFGDHLRAGRFSLQTEVEPEITARFFVVTIIELINQWLHHPELGTADQMVDRLFLLIFRRPVPNRRPL
jgi:AcrR family transcriptional regulator